ncbi:acetyl-coenzyme A synthetase [Devosia enhydra]|uniref:Acetyl-coenzyme A synthetase n=1 Tax=Devosia enhydra TaxID=665118 RepID=A0A1K2I2U9_9HYPH|nr:acetate--CoA ligase [Devosia enhydra]SFZ86714.1 acetyl-coenzyme A synthetase [Devosia enhydra]
MTVAHTPAAPQVFAPHPEAVARTLVTAARYDADYARSLSDPDGFWAEQARRLDWMRFPTRIKNTSFAYPNVSIRWFEDGMLNVSANCIDRHLTDHGETTAIIWEPDHPGDAAQHITYRQLHEEVCRCANVLKSLGVRKGDRVTIYLPMIPEAAYAMLACARIGAIHSVVFGGFSPDSLAGRINDCDSALVITADEGRRGGKSVPLKANVDKALMDCPGVSKVLVVRNTGGEIAMKGSRDVFWHEAAAGVEPVCDPEPMNAEDPLFILYTSGSTGKPKGLLHTTGGYLTYAALTHELSFDYRRGEVFWCTADVGWVTGHSYIVYGPLANGATTLMFEGIPTWPDASRFWQVVERHKVNIFHSAPTAIRSLMGAGNGFVDRHDMPSLRLLGTVGEPINPEAWLWYYNRVGKGRCEIVDAWWQTETGGHMICPFPGATPTKPGSATKPFFGIAPQVLSPEGKVQDETKAEGVLCITESWPGQARTIWGDHQRFVSTYFETYKGRYFTGDGVRRDADGYYWITGRVDDVLNVSGHRLGTAEIESALVAHPQVSEAAVVGYPHDIKGQGIYCFVTLMARAQKSDALMVELRNWVRKEIGPIASPDIIQFAPGLPKTRSGKIMRRILRKIAENDVSSLGDTSTLADPSVVDDLIANRAGGRPSP